MNFIKYQLLALILYTIPITLNAQDITISTDSTFQTIRGFGGAFIEFWQPELTATQVQTAFGRGEEEIGLSILRLGVNPDSTQWDENLEAAQKAQEMGIMIFASPWNTPINMREDIPDTEDYRLRHDMYQEYAEHLNNFAKYLKRNGVDLYGISVQNEPDIGEWTQWTPEEIFTFVKEYGHLITETRLLAPESFQFRRNYSDPILNDSTAAANTDVIVGHIYGAGNARYELAEQKGKEVWMTEYLLNEHTEGLGAEDWESATEEQIWNQTLLMAYTVHKSMDSNMQAYIWWYLKRYYSFLDDGTYSGRNGEVTKRGYAFSHYSKYVRPGFVRVNSVGPFGRGFTRVNSTAYKDTVTSEIVIVTLNQESSDKEINIVINGMNSGIFTPILSTVDETVKSLEDVSVTGNTFSYTLPKESIITFVSSRISVNNEEEAASLPNQIKLNQNYPNPFNPSTVISYQLPVNSEVKLQVFDMLGRQVAELVNGQVVAGYHQVTFDAKNLASGIYFYQLTSESYSVTKKMLLLK